MNGFPCFSCSVSGDILRGSWGHSNGVIILEKSKSLSIAGTYQKNNASTGFCRVSMDCAACQRRFIQLLPSHRPKKGVGGTRALAHSISHLYDSYVWIFVSTSLMSCHTIFPLVIDTIGNSGRIDFIKVLGFPLLLASSARCFALTPTRESSSAAVWTCQVFSWNNLPQGPIRLPCLRRTRAARFLCAAYKVASQGREAMGEMQSSYRLENFHSWIYVDIDLKN